MPITENETAFVDTAALSIGLSQMFSVTAATGNPAYLVLTALDRNEYTAAASGAVGSLSGNGQTAVLGSIGGDGRGAGIVFTYQASAGRYYNSTYGYFDQLIYNASGSLNDVTNLSLFGTNSLSQATAYAANAYAMMQVDPSGYIGSTTVATAPGFTGAVPAQATPNSIAAVAATFVGDAWNMDGCWVLASTIAAEAGASLPVQSTAIGVPGRPNGEWVVAFDGPAGQSGSWQSMVRAGEIVVIGNANGGGHITTVVSGAGSTAMLIDNITYVNGSGQVQNLANDGSSNDIVVAAPHPASQEWSGVQASSVVIYELDTPIVADLVTSDSLAPLGSQPLGPLFSATDPAGKTITAWQVYDTAANDSLSVNNAAVSDHTAATALQTASLSAVSLVAGSVTTTDTLDVRAYNGTYWGDWQSLTVSIVGSTLPVAPAFAPILEIQTPGQTWGGGRPVSLNLPATTFQDPQGEALTYVATLAGGLALPGWLYFNPTTRTFSGIAPGNAQTLGITVTATDTSHLSVADSFSVGILGVPVVSAPTPNQSWAAGASVSLVLPANTFTDPQGQSLTYTAGQSNGQPLPTWLSFNAATETFSGTAPSSAESLGIVVTATDSSGLATSETFAANVRAAAPTSHSGITVTTPTSAQSWADGQSIDLVLPANTFTDALGLKMNFIAYELSGPNVTSWLHFNSTTNTLFGTVPAHATGVVALAVYAVDALHMVAEDMFTATLVASSQKNGSASVPTTLFGAAASYSGASHDLAVLATGFLANNVFGGHS